MLKLFQLFTNKLTVQGYTFLGGKLIVYRLHVVTLTVNTTNTGEGVEGRAVRDSVRCFCIMFSVLVASVYGNLSVLQCFTFLTGKLSVSDSNTGVTTRGITEVGYVGHG